MTEQELRAWSLAIAEIHFGGKFARPAGDKIGLAEGRFAFLKAIEEYIKNGTFLELRRPEPPAFKGSP